MSWSEYWVHGDWHRSGLCERDGAAGQMRLTKRLRLRLGRRRCVVHPEHDRFVEPAAHCLLPRTAMVVFETEHHAALLRSLHRETADQPVI